MFKERWKIIVCLKSVHCFNLCNKKLSLCYVSTLNYSTLWKSWSNQHTLNVWTLGEPFFVFPSYSSHIYILWMETPKKMKNKGNLGYLFMVLLKFFLPRSIFGVRWRNFTKVFLCAFDICMQGLMTSFSKSYFLCYGRNIILRYKS